MSIRHSRQVFFYTLLAIAPACMTAQTQSSPQAGISRELATERERLLSDLRYVLDFELRDGMDETRGICEAHFVLKEQPKTDLTIDFDGASFRGLTINGTRHQVRRVHNHIVLPAKSLRMGKNVMRTIFASKVAATGTPLTVYKDKSDGKNYYYTLVVPADCHRLFPCFDQPGLKARFDLTLRCPSGWAVSGNGQIVDSKVAGATSVHRFAQSAPLSTYLFAFAAGPFKTIASDPEHKVGTANQPMRILLRASKHKQLQADLLFGMHARSAQWLGNYFAHPYPFAKLDIVLCPGFPYGGMEHAGTIFYRESSLLFDHEPTESELTRRSTLIYHEVSHQWFGNLVTMQWFDDLWLKEGFATFVGYTLLENLEPGKHAWLRFLQRVKPRAYRIDATKGTTPVYQQLRNLANAKSAYGAIVYNKAPAVIRELNARLGAPNFQKGLQLFIKRHAFGNATWQDLIAALEKASKQNASLWSTRWILAPGMPNVEAEWTSKNSKITTLRLRQSGVQTESETWPLRLEVLPIRQKGTGKPIRVTLTGASVDVPELIGEPAPNAILLNPRDVAYGQFLLDPISRDWLLDHVDDLSQPLVRATAMNALWETVRAARLAPQRYAETALRLLDKERDAENHAWLLGTLDTCISRYCTGSTKTALSDQLAAVLHGQLRNEKARQLQLQTFRFLVVASSDEATQKLCHGAIKSAEPVPGLKLGWRDRFRAAAALLALGNGGKAVASLRQQAGKEDVAKYAFIAGAAEATEETKQRYFDAYKNLSEPPEQWTEASLGYFHWPGQQELTLPYLDKALGLVNWVKKNRKIFFMPAWIDAFVNGHSSTEALTIVRRFLDDHKDLEPDVRLKLLQSIDGLERAVRIRKRYP